jgi:UDP-N-acetylmuramoyl-tripeptide--D-alanyl-D-alanine ligase
MITSVLSQKGKTIATYKNIDSVYNIPTTILKCTPWTKYLVLEMGIEYPGEMDFYLWLARPKIGVITNIHPTHTQFLGSIQGVAKEKIKLVEALSKGNFAVLNKENSYLKKVANKTKAKVIWYGKGGAIKAENLDFTKDLDNKYTLVVGSDKINVQLPILGQQFVSNSLAAASVGNICGISLSLIKNGLEKFTPPEHRMKPIKLKSGALILDDSYNNNPAAAEGALNTLKRVAKEKVSIVVMGDMLELGRDEEKYHRKIGKLISSLKIDYLIGVGPASKFLVEKASKEMRKNNSHWVPNWKKAVPILQPLLKKDAVVLVKGSRSIGLERLVSRLSTFDS